MFVLDTSCVAKLLRDEPGSEAFRAWFAEAVEGGERVVAPGVLSYELGRLIQRDHAGRKPAFQAEMHRRCLRPIRLEEPDPAEVFRAGSRGLTYADAAFLALASAHGATLVSSDAVMLREARRLRMRHKAFA